MNKKEKINQTAHLIKGSLEEITYFYSEYEAGNFHYRKNLNCVLNNLERLIYALEVIENREEAQRIFDDKLMEVLTDEQIQFLMERVLENQSLFVFLTTHFEDCWEAETEII